MHKILPEVCVHQNRILLFINAAHKNELPSYIQRLFVKHIKKHFIQNQDQCLCFSASTSHFVINCLWFFSNTIFFHHFIHIVCRYNFTFL